MDAVGIVGVGAMGLGVAQALLARGLGVFVHDIVAERQAKAVAAGAIGRDSAAEVAEQAPILVTLVVDAPQTRAVLFGADGAASALTAASTVLMCSTIAPGDAQSIARELAAQGVEMLDAPISGGPARAAAGSLSVMASGSDAAFERCAGVLEAMSHKLFRVGPAPGDGSRMKIVNNMLAAANLAAGCEALALAAKLGLDLRQVRDVVNASSGASWIFADRMAHALEGDYEPRAAARVLTKDIGLLVDTARSLGLVAPMAECAQRAFQDTVDRGYGEEDDAAVLKRYADRLRGEARVASEGLRRVACGLHAFLPSPRSFLEGDPMRKPSPTTLVRRCLARAVRELGAGPVTRTHYFGAPCRARTRPRPPTTPMCSSSSSSAQGNAQAINNAQGSLPTVVSTTQGVVAIGTPIAGARQSARRAAAWIRTATPLADATGRPLILDGRGLVGVAPSLGIPGDSGIVVGTPDTGSASDSGNVQVMILNPRDLARVP